MADSSTNTITRQSSRIAKRLKTTPSTIVSTDVDDDDGGSNVVAPTKQTSVHTKSSDTLTHQPSFTKHQHHYVLLVQLKAIYLRWKMIIYWTRFFHMSEFFNIFSSEVSIDHLKSRIQYCFQRK